MQPISRPRLSGWRVRPREQRIICFFFFCHFISHVLFFLALYDQPLLQEEHFF